MWDLISCFRSSVEITVHSFQIWKNSVQSEQIPKTLYVWMVFTAFLLYCLHFFIQNIAVIQHNFISCSNRNSFFQKEISLHDLYCMLVFQPANVFTKRALLNWKAVKLQLNHVKRVVLHTSFQLNNHNKAIAPNPIQKARIVFASLKTSVGKRDTHNNNNQN